MTGFSGRSLEILLQKALRSARSRVLTVLGVGFVAAGLLTATFSQPALSQGWWPWGDDDRPPVPREPVYRQPQGTTPYPAPNSQQPYPSPDQRSAPQQVQPQPSQQPAQLPPQQAPPQQPAPSTWAGTSGANGQPRNPICFQLEQRLAQESQRGAESRNLMPMVENEIRQQDQQLRSAEQQLERSDCYDYFLFSKTLRRTRKCVDLANQAETSRRRIGDLEAQLAQLAGSSGRSYQDDIVRELARNNCGATYQQQARQRPSENDGDFWNDGESGGAGRSLGNYGNLGYATYRTICVRLCDGYYFPVSFSTLPNHFEQDAQVCASKCAAPAELYYHQNPGQGVDQAVSAQSNLPYTQLKTAFRYRKEFVQGCSCKMAEYVPDPSQPQTQRQGSVAPQPGAAEAAAAGASTGTSGGVDGWSTGVDGAPQTAVSVSPPPAPAAPAQPPAPAKPLPWQR